MGILARFFTDHAQSPGVYRILNRRNGKSYIGSSKRSMRERWHEHRYDLDRGVHHNKALQADWTRYGPRAFRFDVIEVVGVLSLVLKRELYWQEHTKNVYTAQRARVYRGKDELSYCPTAVIWTGNNPTTEQLLTWVSLTCYWDGEWWRSPEQIARFMTQKKKNIIVTEEDVLRVREEHAHYWPPVDQLPLPRTKDEAA